MNNKRSDCLSVTNGSPQDSVLAPFLFTVYINDLPKWPCETVLYADYITLIKYNSSLDDIEKHKIAIFSHLVQN